MFGLGKKNSTESLLLQGKEALQNFERQRDELESQKEQKTARQVELWSLLTPTGDLESEYKEITAEIAYIIQQIMCLDEHINSLQVEGYHCSTDGSCNRLKQLLAIPDPCANVKRNVPVVEYKSDG